jgi:hypothetical protein
MASICKVFLKEKPRYKKKVIKDPAIADNTIMAMLILSIIKESLGEMKKTLLKQ